MNSRAKNGWRDVHQWMLAAPCGAGGSSHPVRRCFVILFLYAPAIFCIRSAFGGRKIVRCKCRGGENANFYD